MFVIMLLDMDIYFDHPSRIYNPGDTISCTIDVQSTFKIRCKYIKVRLRCPYRKSNVEVFRIYEIPNKRNSKQNKQWDYTIGERGWFDVYYRCYFVHHHNYLEMYI